MPAMPREDMGLHVPTRPGMASFVFVSAGLRKADGPQVCDMGSNRKSRTIRVFSHLLSLGTRWVWNSALHPELRGDT